jgi:sugar/nucleoside kinase (ribokinase family)
MTPGDAPDVPAASTGPSPEFDVVLGGTWYADLIFTGLAEPPRLGAELWASGFGMTPGGTYNVVAAMHRLGLRIGWSTVFGNDAFSAFVANEARTEGLDERLFRHVDRPRRVVTASFSMPHDRGFVSFEEWEDVSDDVELIGQYPARCYLASGAWGQPRPADVRRALDARGALLFIDPQFTTATLDMPHVVEGLEAADVFVPNDSEAMQLSGAASAEDALEIFGRHTALAVIKCGSRGAIAMHRGVRYASPALTCDAIDTTGAGDCFNAGLIRGLLDGDSLEDALRLANACAGISTTAHGVTGAPTLAQVRERIASLGVPEPGARDFGAPEPGAPAAT